MYISFCVQRRCPAVRRRRYTERLRQPCGAPEMHTTQPSSSKFRRHPSAALNLSAQWPKSHRASPSSESAWPRLQLSGEGEAGHSRRTL